MSRRRTNRVLRAAQHIPVWRTSPEIRARAALCAALLCAALFRAAPPLAAQSPAPSITAGRDGKPNWVDEPGAAYPEAYYLARVGAAKNRAAAEAAAFAALAGYFGQSVKSRLATVESYREQARGGATAVSQDLLLDNAVEVSANIERLIGAEIGAVWQDAANRSCYALAVMDKAKCAALYASLLDANAALIAGLTVFTAQERASLEAVSRCRRAAGVADASAVFATVLSMLGGPDRRAEIKSGDDYRLEAKNIAAAIPVQVVVENDSGGRVKAAFTAALAEAGYRAGAPGSRYRLEARLNLAPAETADADFSFARFDLAADLKDMRDGSVLSNFSARGREGHSTGAGAGEKAVAAACELVKTAYPTELEALWNR